MLKKKKSLRKFLGPDIHNTRSQSAGWMLVHVLCAEGSSTLVPLGLLFILSDRTGMKSVKYCWRQNSVFYKIWFSLSYPVNSANWGSSLTFILVFAIFCRGFHITLCSSLIVGYGTAFYTVQQELHFNASIATFLQLTFVIVKTPINQIFFFLVSIFRM